MQGPITENGLEGKLPCALRTFGYLDPHRFEREVKAHDPISKPIIVVGKHRLPDGCDALVKLNHKDMRGKVLESDGEAYDSSPGEWLDE